MYTAKDIRNICLMGHGGDGKTTLVEAMLYTAKGSERLGKVTDGNTVSDFDPEEVKRGYSIATSLIPVEFEGSKLNVLDNPGFSAFAGEMLQSLKVCDSAIIVAIILISKSWFMPLMLDILPDWGRLISAVVTLVAMSPFLWALMVKEVNMSLIKKLGEGRANRVPLTLMIVVRILLALFYIIYYLSSVHSQRTGVLLGLSFPAGKGVEKLSRQAQKREYYKVKVNGLTFSLSGMENKVRQMVQRGEEPAEIAWFAQETVCRVVQACTKAAMEEYPGLPVLCSGGVASNGRLKELLRQNCGALFAQPQFSTDNAMGTAVLTWRALERGRRV